MQWFQTNSVALFFGLIAILGTVSGVYTLITTTSSVTITRVATLEHKVDKLFERGGSQTTDVITLKVQQAEAQKYWVTTNEIFRENTKALQGVVTALEVWTERWDNIEARLEKLEDSKPSSYIR